MATRLDLEYTRQFTTFDIQQIIARATVSINVLQQLGAAYQNLPGVEMAAYQLLVDGTEADLAAFHQLMNQLVALLMNLDAKAGPLRDMNMKVLKALRGLLLTSAEVTLLDQITGPTAQGGGGRREDLTRS